MELKKAIQPTIINYKGEESYILSEGSKVKFRRKIPGSGWEDFLEAEVPEGKQWNFIVTIVAHESDEV